MIAYRMTHEKYIHDLSGYGAYLYGGRWSLKGQYVLYAAEHKSLSYLEYLVHQFERDTWPKYLHLATIEINEEVEELQVAELPAGWNHLEYHIESQMVTTIHFKNNLGLKVPSVIVPGEFNIILNPLHTKYSSAVKTVKTEAVSFDERFRKN